MSWGWLGLDPGADPGQCPAWLTRSQGLSFRERTELLSQHSAESWPSPDFLSAQWGPPQPCGLRLSVDGAAGLKGTHKRKQKRKIYYLKNLTANNRVMKEGDEFLKRDFCLRHRERRGKHSPRNRMTEDDGDGKRPHSRSQGTRLKHSPSLCHIGGRAGGRGHRCGWRESFPS